MLGDDAGLRLESSTSIVARYRKPKEQLIVFSSRLSG